MRTVSRRLRLEHLEERTVPAGIVNASLSGGTLTITAVDDPNDVNILFTNNQNITLDGAGANNVTILANNGETGTAITGSPFAGVTSIKLVMGLGTDIVTITDTTITGAVDFQGGSGNNTLNIDGTGNFSVLAGATPGNNTVGSLKFTNGDGLDTLEIGGGTNAINGSVTIANGVGGSTTSFGSQIADITTVSGSVKATNLDGFDSFHTSGATATITGAIGISNGNGGSNTTFGATTSTLTGGITVTCGAGNDDFITGGTTFTVGTPAVRRNLTISNGTGLANTDQNFNAVTNTINGNISVTALAGDDDFSVNGTNFNVLGSVKISTGTGGSSTSITPAQIVDIDGAVSVTAGEGVDNLDFDGGTSVNLLSVTFNSGNGTSNLTFSGGSNTVSGSITHISAAGNSSTTFDATTQVVGGTITSTHGDGSDDFDANGTDFTAAAITIRNGAGGSSTAINASNSNTLSGAISVTNGDGSDTFASGGTTWTVGSLAARKNLTISNGNGNSNSAFDATTTTVHGNLKVTNGDGLDDFTLGGGTFVVSGTGSLALSNGVGGSITGLSAATSTTIGGSLNFAATDGNDDVTLLKVTVSGAASFSTGNGTDTILANNSTFAAFKATTGAGYDSVLIEDGTVNDGIGSVFNGAVSIDLGTGGDQLILGTIGDLDDFADFNAAVSLKGGLDLDILRMFDNVANTFAIAPVESGFEQGT